MNSTIQLHQKMLEKGLELALVSAGTDKTAHGYLLPAAAWFEKNAEIDPINAAQYRYLAALGYYIAGHYAQAYVIFRNTTSVPAPYTAYSLLRRLFAKEFVEIAIDSNALLSCMEYKDESIAGNLTSGLLTEGDAIEQAIIASMHMAFLDVHAFVRTGDPHKIDNALGLLDTCYRIATDLSFPQTEDYPTILRGAKAILLELRNNSIWTQLEVMRSTDDKKLVQRYIELAVRRSPPFVELWPSQVVAIPKINEGTPGKRPNFLVKMPTSAGKTNIAELSILRFLMDFPQGSDKKCIYIAPFHALGSQVEATLQKNFLPLGVGVSDLYGGFEINPADRFLFDQQRILVATPEKVDALFRYDPDFASQIGLILIDEGHIIEDPERGLRFEMLIHRLVCRYANGGVRLILASAVLGRTDSLIQWITGATNGDGLQTSHFRPTRSYLGLLSWDGQVATRELTHVSDLEVGGYTPIHAPKDVRFQALPRIDLNDQQIPLFKSDKSLQTDHKSKRRNGRDFPKRNAKYETVALAALREAREGMTLVYVP